MKKISFFIVLLSFCMISIKAEGLKFIQAETLQEAIDKSKKDGMILMVELYREKCPSCVQLETLTFPSDIVGDALNQNIVCYRIDGEKGSGVEIFKKYRGVAFPTLLFFKDGVFIERSIGAGEGPEHFVDRVKNLLMNYDLSW